MRLIDNKSSVTINNADFGDLSFVTPAASTVTTPTPNANPATLDGIIEQLHATHMSGDLQGIVESKEDEMLNGSYTLSTPASPTPYRLPTHAAQDSMSTPFGEMHIDATIDIRAKHRRTSSLMARQKRGAMRSYGELVWDKLAVQSGRGASLTQRMFDIELNNHGIHGDPDVCKELFLTIQPADVDAARKKLIVKADVCRVCGELERIPLVDEIASDTLKDDAADMKRWIVLKQVFVHIAEGSPFDIAQYLVVRLSTDELNDVDTLLDWIGSRDKEWTTRLRILKWITANLEHSQPLRALTNDDYLGT